MHLKAERDVAFAVDGHFFRMAQGETIHTENSLKYGPRDVRFCFGQAVGRLLTMWTDREELFTVILAQETAKQSGSQERPHRSVADRDMLAAWRARCGMMGDFVAIERPRANENWARSNVQISRYPLIHSRNDNKTGATVAL